MSIQKIFILCFSGMFFLHCSTSHSKVNHSPSQDQAIQGGMWIPNEVNEQDMKSKGLKIPVKELFNPKIPTIKDAIAQFNRGCTSELISPKGLLLTNHHCGYGEIQAHSTLEHDYLKEGFWAYNFSEELPNPSSTATFIIDMQDVTEYVNTGVSELMDEEKKLQFQKENIENLIKNTVKEPYQEVEIKSYFEGNKYYKIISETYKDVRLVGAPPSSIGKFGSDTDNWMWPRHTGDFSLFRIYADKNNHPAEYSPDNVPYQPKKYLTISIKGIKEGDFTMVYGFPGRTQEYLPSEALVNVTQITNPTAIKVREIALGILNQKMRIDDATRIKYASKYASVSNYYKKWIGEDTGIAQTHGIEKKKAYEQLFSNQLATKLLNQEENSNVLTELTALHKMQAPYLKPLSLYKETFLRNSETLLLAYYYSMLVEAFEKPDYAKTKQRVINSVSRIYANYDSELDKEVTQQLLNNYIENSDPSQRSQNVDEVQNHLSEYWNRTLITGKNWLNENEMKASIEKLFESDAELISTLKKDPLVQLAQAERASYLQKTEGPFQQTQNRIDVLQSQYMKEQMLVFSDKKFYPDANSTLRITYGNVKPYPNDKGIMYPYQTYLSGVMDKYIPGDYEFDVSEKLKNLYQQKNYGRYGEGDKMPVNFIATNHTTGGNSGSPALDAYGNLIGLNFDRVWEGTMSDLYYDPSICRNIMVDVRYILFVIDKYANAQNLMDELNIIE